MSKNMIYGDNEVTNLTDKVAGITIAEGKAIKFANGKFNAETIKNFATAASAQDGKIRFVYDAAGDSGMIFVGNQLVSSKILDIDANVIEKKEFDKTTGEYKETTYQTSDTITVTWFDATVGEQKETKFNVIDEKTVSNMIAAAVKKSSSDLTEKVNALELKHTDDVSRLDTSVSSIETLLKNDVVSAETGSALTVTSVADTKGYKTYKVTVNVDDAEKAPIKVVDDKIKIATYKIAKVADASMEKDGEETKYASEYQLIMTSPDGKTTTPVGDKINIAKDFFVKSAHVCTFNYASNEGEGTKIADELIGKDVTTENLPYSKNADGTWEQARIGHGIKYGHSYLHLIINTKTEKKAVADLDVYLDFTDIFTTFKSGDEFIKVQNGVVSLNIDAVSTAIDTKLKVNETFTALKAKDTAIDGHLGKLDTSVSAIEKAYVKDASLEAPKAGNKQFNTLKITNHKVSAEGVASEEVVTVDVANQTYYDGLNTALNTLQNNDTYLKGLLTWESL